MSEANNKHIGDGQEDYKRVAKQTGRNAFNVGKDTVKATAKVAKETAKATAKTAQTATKATTTVVKTGVEAGKTIVEITAGTVSGGPWGALASILWTLKDVIIKILVGIYVAISIILLAVILVKILLPAIVIQDIRDNYSETKSTEGNVLEMSYSGLAADIEESINIAYQKAKQKGRETLSDGKYDSELSEECFAEEIGETFNYEYAYILAIYSISMEQSGTSREHLFSILNDSHDKLFYVTVTEKNVQKLIEQDGNTVMQTVTYALCNIEPYSKDTLFEIFGVDKDSEYKNYGITCEKYAEYMAEALSNTVAGIEK